MRYKNKKTGMVREFVSVITSEDWIPLNPPAAPKAAEKPKRGRKKG